MPQIPIRPLLTWLVLAMLGPGWTTLDAANARTAPQLATIAETLTAEADTVIATLRVEPQDSLRVAAWRALLDRLAAASERVLREPTTVPDADALRILKLKSYFDLVPAAPPAPADRVRFCTTLLASAGPGIREPTPDDLSPEARLAFMALAAWYREDTLPCFAATAGPPAEVRQAIAEKLHGDFPSRVDFDTAVAEAEVAGVPVDEIVRAQIENGVREDDDDLLQLALARTRTAADGAGWSLKTRCLLLVARGELAGRALRLDEAERLFRDAFWLEPGQAGLIVRAAAFTRTMQRMAGVKLDLGRALADSIGGTTTLGALLRDRKGLLLEFWASWCEPCLKALPKLRQQQPQLAARGITVAGVNVEKDAAKADRVRREQSISFPWLLDMPREPLAKQLGIDSIPRAVLIAADGRIVFNGPPDGVALEAALDLLIGDKR